MSVGPYADLTDAEVDALVAVERTGWSHPWAPIALDPATIEPPSPPSILVAEDGQGALIYPGMRHLLFGSTEALKSWTCAVAAVEQAQAGFDTVWLDADAMGRAALVERLRALRLSDELIRKHIHYMAPDQALDAEGSVHLDHVLDALNVGLVVIDAHDPALELQGLDPNSTADVQHFSRVVVDVFHSRGIATLVPDHVARGGDGKDPIASQRKVSGFDVAISIKLVGEPMTRNRPTATVELFGRKDRPGWHDRNGPDRRLGEIHFDLDATPPWRLVLNRGDAAERPNVPTVLMQRVSRFLEMQSTPASMTAIENAVQGKSKGIRWAIESLVRLGYIVTVAGRQKGVVAYLSERPYREGDEGDPVPTPSPPNSNDPVPPRPQPRPSENPTAMRDSATPSHPVPTPSPASPLTPSPKPKPLQGVWGAGVVGSTSTTTGDPSVSDGEGPPEWVQEGYATEGEYLAELRDWDDVLRRDGWTLPAPRLDPDGHAMRGGA